MVLAARYRLRRGAIILDRLREAGGVAKL
jgi:hypothetical protein